MPCSVYQESGTYSAFDVRVTTMMVAMPVTGGGVRVVYSSLRGRVDGYDIGLPAKADG